MKRMKRRRKMSLSMSNGVSEEGRWKDSILMDARILYSAASGARKLLQFIVYDFTTHCLCRRTIFVLACSHNLFADMDEPDEGRQEGLVGHLREPGQCERSFRQRVVRFRELCTVSLWSAVVAQLGTTISWRPSNELHQSFSMHTISCTFMQSNSLPQLLKISVSRDTIFEDSYAQVYHFCHLPPSPIISHHLPSSPTISHHLPPSPTISHHLPQFSTNLPPSPTIFHHLPPSSTIFHHLPQFSTIFHYLPPFHTYLFTCILTCTHPHIHRS